MIKVWNGYPRSVTILRNKGLQRISIYHPTKQPTPNMTYIDEFVEEVCGGIYLRWLGKNSEYDYHLFNKEYIEQVKTKSLGRIINNDPDRARALSSTHDIGKETYSSFRISTKETQEEMQRIKMVLSSPEVYVFNPQSVLGTQNCAEFTKVFPRAGQQTVRNTKNNTIGLKFTIEFDKNNVQSII